MFKNLVWNVYNEYGNDLISENIFNSVSFCEGVLKIKKQMKATSHAPDFFETELNKLCLYCFDGRAEYEIGLTTWPAFIDNKEIAKLVKENHNYRSTVNLSWYKKISIYDQLKLNWPIFSQYILDNVILKNKNSKRKK